MSVDALIDIILSLTVMTNDLYAIKVHSIFTKTSVALEISLCQYFGSNEKNRLR
jgi:hypothetical protein